MPRYYILTEFTPSVKQHGVIHQRVYPGAPTGFVFHDTEKDLSVKDILRPLHRLADLFDNATRVLIIRQTSNTLVATFSLSGFLTPALIRAAYWKSSPDDHEWLTRHAPEGWLIPDIHNPAQAPIQCNPDDLYSQCTELLRYTGGCPCDLLASGECVRRNVYPHLPPEFTEEVMRTDYMILKDNLKRVKYKTVSGFTYITGGHTTTTEFSEAIRPWDTHDFSVVSKRQTALSNRGKLRHIRKKFKEAHCRTCCFVTTVYHSGGVEHCGDIANCESATRTTDAWLLLYNWYNNHSGFENMPGFTAVQRDYLIRAAGTETRARLFTNRRCKTLYGGFVFAVGEWRYCLSAAAGDLQRNLKVSSWKQLKSYLPELPDIIDTPRVDAQTKLACAALGTGYVVRRRPYHPVYKIVLEHGYVEAVGAACRYLSGSELLDTGVNADVKPYFTVIFGYRYGAARNHMKLRLPTV
jgi:hypothetical protein